MIQKLFGGKKKDYFLEVDDAKGVKSADKPQETPKTEAPKPEEAAPVAETKTEKKAEKPAKAAKKSAKKSKSAKPAPKAEPTPAAPVAAQSNGKVEPKEVEFATKYLIVPTGSRRRPGPSLNPFKAMARQVKVPRK